jgi:hypothetical protein
MPVLPVACRKGTPTDSRQDYELTDWDDRPRFVDTFATAERVAPSWSREPQYALSRSVGTSLRSP